MIFLDANLLVYLNVGVRSVAEFFEELVESHSLCTDVLVLDETIYVSWRKYGIPFEHTARFLDEIVIPHARILTLGYEDRAKELFNVLKPSDALHVAAMLNNGVHVIASEDEDFERVKEVRRVWVTKPAR